MSGSRIDNYYDEQYSSSQHGDNWIKLPFNRVDYYGLPLRRLGCKKGERLLDIACGNGQFLHRAESLGLQCYGIDISGVAIEKARELCKADMVCSDVNDGLPYKENFFDYVTCLGSLEHFEKQTYILSEIRRVTKPSGQIYIFVPNKDYFLHKFGYETDFQPVVNRYSFLGYKELLIKSGLVIERVFCDNSHISDLDRTSSWLKLILKLMAHLFVRFIPLRYSYSFIFICKPATEKE